jgi:alkylation response protein AidB-like acyl-CoA dehydrogenase
MSAAPAGRAWAGPRQYGGGNLPLTRQAIFHEEQARIGAPLGVNIIGHGILGPTLIHFASEAQKQRFLPGILANRDIWCQGYSEPGAGSDLAALTTRAEPGRSLPAQRPQDLDLVRAHRRLLLRAGAHRCHGPAPQGHQLLLVDMKLPGVRVAPIRQITGEADFNEVFFEDVKVPLDALVGEENGGWRLAMAAASFERGTYFIPRQVRFAGGRGAQATGCKNAGRQRHQHAGQSAPAPRYRAPAVDSHVLNSSPGAH